MDFKPVDWLHSHQVIRVKHPITILKSPLKPYWNMIYTD